MLLLKKKLFLFILIFPFFKPRFFDTISTIDIIYDILKIICALLILVLYIKFDRISVIIVCNCILQLLVITSTLINDGDYIQCIANSFSIIAICMLTEMSLKINSRNLFSVLFFILNILIYTNFILLIIFPEGLALNEDYYRINFLAIDNRLAPILIPSISIGIIYSLLKKSKITIGTINLSIIVSLTTIIVWSATGVIGWFILIFYLIFIYNRYIDKFLNFAIYFILNLAVFISIVFIRLQNLFAFIIEDILHKNVTFTGRTDIWDLAFEHIAKSPLLGYGSTKDGIIMYKGYLFHAHNQILQLILDGGIGTCIFFILIIILSGRKLMRYRKDNISKIISVTIFAFLTMMVVEYYSGSLLLFYTMLIMGYHVEIIIKQNKG